PNPLIGAAEIPFSLEAPGPVHLTIFNVLGQPVRTLIDGEKAAGRDAVVWDGRDDVGDPVSSGVYLYRMVTATSHATRRLLLLR
ncbi:FlgD immunoglobulin-like domain containing protein, partial [Candidatus Latescibacterota bacterium]